LTYYIDEKDVAQANRILGLEPGTSLLPHLGKTGAANQGIGRRGQGLQNRGSNLPSERQISVPSNNGKVNITVAEDAPRRLKGVKFSLLKPKQEEPAQEELELEQRAGYHPDAEEPLRGIIVDRPR
jgi:hypothetical protein